jgi:5,5'-dehydrodivanillate O-demethylase
MLSKEENELLTRVGPGTPAGTLLRRYWHPAAFVADLPDERPLKRVKIMHEELVLFRDKQGNYGCLAEHCAHRGTSLYYGFLEDCGLRCAYHGWKYAPDGQCLEQPFEPPGSTYKERVRQGAYPVEKLAGLLFVYMGPPEKKPLLPRYDVLAWTNGHRELMRQEDLDCNWLQAMENSADVTHTYFLHGHTLYQQGHRGREVEYYHRPIEQYGFQTFELGLVKSWRYAAGESFLGPERGGGNPLVFPNILRVMEGPLHAMHWRVPIDDTHTRIYHAGFLRGKPQSPEERENPPVVDHRPQKRPDGEYTMDSFFSHDKMAWETQGALYDRSTEHLGASDRGIVLYRQMVREQIEAVQRGEDPIGLIRDPAQNEVIELPAWMAELDEARFAEAHGELPMASSMDAVFDERHQVFEVPFGAARPQNS